MPAPVAKPRNRHAIVAIHILYFVCSGCQNGWDTKAYRRAVRSGRLLIAPAMALEAQFPKTEHMLIMYGHTGTAKHEWKTVSFFGGRYELTMTVNVILKSDGMKIAKVVGKPKFYLHVCKELLDGGATYDGSRELVFGVKKWNEFRDSGFDLRVLDPDYDGSTLRNFDEYADDVQRNRKMWR